jgi:hypothetical protein
MKIANVINLAVAFGGQANRNYGYGVAALCHVYGVTTFEMSVFNDHIYAVDRIFTGRHSKEYGSL